MNEKFFFYDGNCHFCKNLANYLIQKNTNPELEFISFRNISEIELQRIHSELTINRMEAEVQLVWEGKRYPGFFAIRKIFPYLKIYKFFTPILYFPLIPFLGIVFLILLKKIVKN